MERKQVRMARTAGAVASLWVVAACASMLGGCSSGNGKTAGGDDRFAAPTADEYTQPLENVVVGTPGGVYRGARLLPDGRIIGGALESNELQRGLAQPNRVDAVVVTSGSNGPGPSASHSTSTVTLTETGTTTAVAPSTSTSRSNAASTSTIVGTGTTSIEFSTSTPAGGFGQWHFDDCSPTSNFLTDASGAGANAQQALGAACVPGISGLGVKIETAKEVVQVPDEPQFTVTNRIGVAAWVNPDTVDGDQPIIIKRLKNDTSFSLGIHNGNIQMSVVTASGTTVISQAPIQAGVWTHVAGMYDGTFVFLFINGQQFGQVYAGEDLHDVFAPIRIGATTGSQSFHGIIDEVFVSTQAISSSTLTALSCIPRPSTVTVAASATGPQPFDTTVHYDVNVADNDVGACGSKFYEFFQNTSSSGFNVSFDSGNVNIITPGESATFGVEIASTEDADPGPNAIFFILDAFEESIFSQEESFNVELDYDVAQPTGCFVTTKRELFITSTSVVDDPVRTFGNTQPGFFAGGGSSSSSSGIVVVDASGPPPPLAAVDASVFDASVGETGVPESSAPASSQGVWSFAHLMREMAPTEDQAPQLVLKLLQLFLSDQQVNGFTVKAKPLMQQDLIDIWPKLANGDLDLDQAPLTLDAIVNRVDIRNLAQGNAGEGRFVFSVNGPAFQNFNIILEYNLPAQTQDDVQNWANRWHALQALPFPSEAYNAALEAVTRGFTDRGAMPSGVNGNALNEFRTNELALSNFNEWELRGFVLDPSTGFFAETTVKETPDISFNGTSTLADFTNQNAAAIEAEVPAANDNTVPATFEGQSFLGGSALNPFFAWNAPGITDPEARFHMSLNTCNGCHGPDTGTPNFQMVLARSPGQESSLAPFLTGVSVFDQFTGQTRTLNDLARRRGDLESLVCGTDGGSGSGSSSSSSSSSSSVGTGGTIGGVGGTATGGTGIVTTGGTGVGTGGGTTAGSAGGGTTGFGGTTGGGSAGGFSGGGVLPADAGGTAGN